MPERDPLLIRIKRRVGGLLNIPQVNALRGVPMPGVTGEAAQIAIARQLSEGRCLIARVGWTEGRTVAFYQSERLANTARTPYPDIHRVEMKSHSGFFPGTDAALDRFADLYLRAIDNIDIYASWMPFDRQLLPKGRTVCRLRDLDPFFTRNRWSLCLAGKRVTVVSPFRDTIERQWQKRAALFRQPTLPEMTLSVVRAFQTVAGADVSDSDWFANLAAMDDQIRDSNPDVVIIGAGAYGLPLGLMAKQRGAGVVVMGGTTQLLFGIMGNRWEIDPAYRNLMTPAWTRPGQEERPPGYQSLETAGGAYW